MKQTLSVLLVALLLMGTIGTASLAEGSSGWDTGKKAQVVISTINNYYTAGLEKLCVEYNKLHPETEVVLDIISDNDTYKTNFITKASTDISLAPDIYHFNVAGVSTEESLSQGWVLDLNEGWLDMPNPYADGKTTRELIAPYWMARAISDQKGYATYVPFDNVTVCVYYNKDIFEKVGLEVPTTYEEWIDICEKLVGAGYAKPIGASFVAGWYAASLADTAYRYRTDEFMTMPGDAMWDDKTCAANLTVQYAPDDISFDDGVIFNAERNNTYQMENGFINGSNRDIWSKFLGLARFFQNGWSTPDENSVNANFITQQVPMLINGSWVIGDFVAQVAQLPENLQFAWGTFPFVGPENAGKEGEEVYKSVYRGFMTMGHLMSITPKDEDQTARAMDVLMYWYSPMGAQMIYDETLNNGNFVQGPPLVEGVKLSDEIMGYLGSLGANGSYNGQWTTVLSSHLNATTADMPVLHDLLNRYSSGEMEIDEFMEKANEVWMRRAAEDKERNGYDGDPTTKDTPPN